MATDSDLHPTYGIDYVRSISPYVGGRPIAEVAREIGMPEASIVKLASNENPLGMSPLARQAVLDALAEAPRYPDNDSYALRRALAAQLQVPPEWIVLGHGSSDILEMAARALLAEGDSCVYSQYGFVVYGLAVQQAGARHIVVPARDFGHDLDAMAQAIGADTRLVYVTNPNNPTGTAVPPAAIEAFVRSVPERVVIVLDEAYVEYLEPGMRGDSIALARAHPNLIVSRTFSKAYGLAGLRIGYAVAQPGLIDLLGRVRSAFNTGTLAQAAAVAALRDTDFLQRTVAANAAGMRQLVAAFDALGLRHVPSHANFVLVRMGDDELAGARLAAALLRQGVIVRPVGGYGLGQWLRISVGTAEENARCIDALQQALRAGA
jgi:histidinol-phosphate aminotransferase